MKCFVLGAGVSKSVGYPLGSELFDEIDKFIQESGACVDRFDYRKDWPRLRDWLKSNTNPIVAQSCRSNNIEHIFTVLDSAIELRGAAQWSAHKCKTEAERKKLFAESVNFDSHVEDYTKYRRILLWALEQYFSVRHEDDNSESKEWNSLKTFGEKLEPGDVVITFNYDAALERVLLGQGKWSPKNGFGFELVFQKSKFENEQTEFCESKILVLHLHGATGWYRRPLFAPGCAPKGRGAVPRRTFGAAPLSTEISLDPLFLRGLGIQNVDACLPDLASVGHDSHVLIHPSFLKDYETSETGSHVFLDLWRKAAQALREAELTYIIGYSLPRADVAALTLFLTNCNPGTVYVINPDGGAKMRLGRLFQSGGKFDGAVTFEEWASLGCPETVPWKPKAKVSPLVNI
ncbi:MAG: hypothetical protein WCF48_06730 [Terriglobales bacterium]